MINNQALDLSAKFSNENGACSTKILTSDLIFSFSNLSSDAGGLFFCSNKNHEKIRQYEITVLRKLFSFVY